MRHPSLRSRAAAVWAASFSIAFLSAAAPAAIAAQEWRQAEPGWFSGRQNPAVAVMDGALYLAGGMRMAMTTLMCDDVWMSRDGESWTPLAADAPFPSRQGASLTAFGGKLYLIGGYDDSLYASDNGDAFRDAWVSIDGREWERIDIGIENPGVWTDEENGKLIAFAANGRLYVFDDAGEGVTLLRSDDGVGFAATPLRDLADIDLAWHFHGRLFALSLANFQLYVSDDGEAWRQLPDPGPSLKTAPTEFGGRLYGIDDTGLVVSDDGIVWSPAPGFADPPGLIRLQEGGRGAAYRESTRDGAAFAVFKDRLFVIGGGLGSWSSSPGVSIGATTMEDDYWSSADGRVWKRHAAPHGDDRPVPRFAPAGAVHDGRLYIMGGLLDPAHDRLLADCWAYGVAEEDPTVGGDWELKVSEVSNYRWEEERGIWEPRAYAAAASFKGRLWISGGLANTDEGDPASYRADVWSSADGTVWRRENAAAGFGPRSGHSLIAHGGKLFVIGGEGPSPDAPETIVTREDLWESDDGVDWRPVAATAPPRFAAFQASASAGGRMWLAGGLYRSDDAAYATREVWSSADGREWRREASLVDFAFGLSGAAVGASFAAIGGRMNAELHDMLCVYNTDGERRGFAAEAYPAANGALGVSGGYLVYYPGRDDIDGAPSGSVWLLPTAALE